MSRKRIYVTDTEALTTALDTIAGRVERRVEVKDVEFAVKRAEATLTGILGIPKKQWSQGISLRVNPVRNRQPGVNAYRYRATAVEVVLRYAAAKGWYVDEDASRKTGALNDTIANRREWFLVVPENLIDPSRVLEGVGVQPQRETTAA